MVVIDEEKLDEMVRRAVKDEMESILSSTGKVMDYIIGVAAKSEREDTPPERESKLQKKEATPKEKEQALQLIQSLEKAYFNRQRSNIREFRWIFR